jgi:hypothetical protein
MDQRSKRITSVTILSLSAPRERHAGLTLTSPLTLLAFW